jgi:ring-1,2-phenylacetyl-CoA epoxidase subunit PaaE
MMTTVETVLKEKNIDKKHIHVEHFNNEGSQSVDASNFVEAQLAVTLNGKRYNFSVPKGKTILDVMIQNKVDAPYSCTSGACSTCMAKVLKGSVKMDACFALDDDEVAAGYVLTCQSHPTAAEVEVSYDV